MDYNLNNLKFDKYVLDIGTGDGRYVYKSALLNPNTLYIGIDPASNLKEYQREINRKKLTNAILLKSSIENFDPKISSIFDQISVILPWGNLLKYVVIVDQDFFIKIASWMKPSSKLQIIFGFNEELEEKETKRLSLTELTEKEVEFIKEKYHNLKDFKLEIFEEINNKDLKQFETTWAKKLTFGANRKYIYVNLKKT